MSTMNLENVSYAISDSLTYQSCLDLGTDLIAEHVAWRERELPGLDGIKRDFCERDLSNLRAAHAELEARYAH